MKKQFFRVKQLADQAIYRHEKSEIVTEDLAETERRVESLRSICHNVRRRLADTVTSTKSDDQSKRLKKSSSHQMGMAMKDGCSLLGYDTLIGRVLDECGTLYTRLAQERLGVEQLLEETVLENSILPQLLDTDIPQVQKLRKHLNRLTLDTDALRSRLQSSQRNQAALSTISSSFSNHNHSQQQQQQKLDSVRDELDLTQTKLEQQKDTWAGDMFSVLSRESDLAHLFFYQLRLQLEYHRSCFKLLEDSLPQLEHSINSASTKPVYGLSLDEHLRVSDRQVALPIQLCVCRLLLLGTNVEGLFRMAGSASKVRKLKACLDAGRWTDASFLSCSDAHAFADTLKSYLRTLPEPLMFSQLFDEWMGVAQLKDEEDKIACIESVLKRLPQSHYVNLRFLIKFMAHVCKDYTVTKMTSHNLSIVIAPNLLWKGEAALNMATTGTQTLVVELLIRHCHRFFPQEVNFFEGFEDIVGFAESNTTPPDGTDSDECLSTGSVSKLSGNDGSSPPGVVTCHGPAVGQPATTPVLLRRPANHCPAETNPDHRQSTARHSSLFTDSSIDSSELQPSTLRRRKKQTAPTPPTQLRTSLASSSLPPPPPRPPVPSTVSPTAGDRPPAAAHDSGICEERTAASPAPSRREESRHVGAPSQPAAFSTSQGAVPDRPLPAVPVVPVPLPRVQVHVRSRSQTDTVPRPAERSTLENQMSFRRPRPRVETGSTESIQSPEPSVRPVKPIKPVFQRSKEETKTPDDDNGSLTDRSDAASQIRPRPSLRERPDRPRVVSTLYPVSAPDSTTTPPGTGQ